MASPTVYPALPETDNSEALKARWSDVVETVKQHLKGTKDCVDANNIPPSLRAIIIAHRKSLLCAGGVDKSMPQTAIYKFVNLKAENHWEQVGSLN